MSAKLFFYIFSVCLFSTRAELSYTIFRSVAEPESLKLKIDGSIPLPGFDRESESELESANEEFRAAKYKVYSDARTGMEIGADGDYYASPATPSESSLENAALDKDITQLLKELAEHNKSIVEAHAVIEIRNASATSATTKKRILRQNHRLSKTVPAETTLSLSGELHQTSVPVSLRIPTTATADVKPHKVKNDVKIKQLAQHVYNQAIKAFQQMKKNTDAYTQQKIDSLVDIYKHKFSEFLKKTGSTDIRTNQGTQNVILHTIDTSNLIVKRLINFLRNEKLPSGGSYLRGGSDTQIQKEVDKLRTTEFEHACKMFRICRTSDGFRAELQYILSTILSTSDEKLIQANDAATETLKSNELSFIIPSNPLQRKIKKSIKRQEKIDAMTLRENLMMLYGALSKSHLPLVVEKDNAYGKMAVQRTVLFRSILDALDEALPAVGDNKTKWAEIRGGIKKWVGGGRGLQEAFQTLVSNVKSGMERYDGTSKLQDMVHDVATSFMEEE